MEILKGASLHRRHHTTFLALVGAASLATAALFVDGWLQRDWLASKWLFRAPWGLAGLGLCAVLAAVSFLGLVLAWRAGRWVSTSWASLRWILPMLALGWACIWTIELPPLLYDAELALAGAAAVWSASVAVFALRPDRLRSRWVRTLEILVLELAVCAVLTEFGLRLLRSATEISLLATGGTDVDAWLRTHRLRPGSFHLGFPVNADGMVDVEPSQASQRENLVVCLGDSFSVAVVPHHLHYTSVAESRFDDLEVYNLGIVNGGPREYLRLLQLYGAGLHPDLVVVALFLGNDILDAQRDVSTPLTTWMRRDEILILQVPRRLWGLARERLAGREAAAGEGLSAETFGLSANEALSSAEVESRLPWLTDPLAEPPTLSQERFWYVENTRARITLPENAGEFRGALDLLDRIRVEAGPIPVACLLFPDEFQVEEQTWADVLWEETFDGADRDLPQKTVGAWLDERGIPYVDLLPRLRAVPPLADGRRHVYHLRDTHFNARGNRIAGEALAELIERCSLSGARRRR